jgi:hypothetical protein
VPDRVLYVLLCKMLVDGYMTNIALRVVVEVPQDKFVHHHGPRSMYLSIVHEAVPVDYTRPRFLAATLN